MTRIIGKPGPPRYYSACCAYRSGGEEKFPLIRQQPPHQEVRRAVILTFSCFAFSMHYLSPYVIINGARCGDRGPLARLLPRVTNPQLIMR